LTAPGRDLGGGTGLHRDPGATPRPPALRAALDPGSEAWMRGLPGAPLEPFLERMRALPPSRVLPVPAGKLVLFRGERPTGITIPILGYLLDAPGGRLVVDSGLGARWKTGGARAEYAAGATARAEVLGEEHRAPEARGAAGSEQGPGQPATPEPGEAPEDGPTPGMRYRPLLEGPTLAEGVQALGFEPERLVCTHLHVDHAGGGAELGLPVEAAPAEWAAVEARAKGYAVEELAGVRRLEVMPRPAEPFGPLPASTWLADGVLALDTAGHTAGSISILFRLGGGDARGSGSATAGPSHLPAWGLICGDAVYPLLDQPESPAFRAMLRLRRLLEELPGLLILPAHDTAIQRAGRALGWIS
jgi:glyoxylase-like metal-dependent hydrolase (beta-lactamase superfamily II)